MPSQAKFDLRIFQQYNPKVKLENGMLECNTNYAVIYKTTQLFEKTTHSVHNLFELESMFFD